MLSIAFLTAVGGACAAGGSHGAVAPPLAVSVSGSDSGPCTTAQPCLTFNRAYQAAGCGQTVTITPGSYPAQTIGNDPTKNACSATSRVDFQPAGPVTVQALTLAANNGGPTHLQLSGLTSSGYVYVGPAADDISLQNLTALSINIFGASNVTVHGGSYGPCTETAALSNCVAHISDATLGGTHYNPSNILIDGVTFHDFLTTDPANYHVECLFLVAGGPITIQNSTFYHCQDYDIFAQNYTNSTPGSTPPHDVTLQNNLFGSAYDTHTAPWTTPKNTTIYISPRGLPWTNWTVRYNSFYQGTVVNGKSTAGGFGFGTTGPDTGSTLTNATITGNLMGNIGCIPGATYTSNILVAFSPTTNNTTCGSSDTLQAYNAANFGFVDPADLPLGNWQRVP